MRSEILVYELTASPLGFLAGYVGVPSGVMLQGSSDFMDTEVWHDLVEGESRSGERFVARLLPVLEAAREAIVGDRVNDPGVLGRGSYEQFTLSTTVDEGGAPSIIGPFVVVVEHTPAGDKVILLTGFHEGYDSESGTITDYQVFPTSVVPDTAEATDEQT